MQTIGRALMSDRWEGHRLMAQDTLVDRDAGMRDPGVAATSVHVARTVMNGQLALSGALIAWIGIVGSSHRTWAVLAGPLCLLVWQFTLNGANWLRAGERRL